MFARNTPGPSYAEVTTIIDSDSCVPGTHTVTYTVNEPGFRFTIGPVELPAQTTVLDSLIWDLRRDLRGSTLVRADTVGVLLETTSLDPLQSRNVNFPMRIIDGHATVPLPRTIKPDIDQVSNATAAETRCAPQVELTVEETRGIPSSLRVQTSINPWPDECVPARLRVNLTFRTPNGDVLQWRVSFQQAAGSLDFRVPIRGLFPPFGDERGNLKRGLALLSEGALASLDCVVAYHHRLRPR